MESKEYTQVFVNIFDAMTTILNGLERCLLTHDQGALKKIEKEFKESRDVNLPLVTQLAERETKDDLEMKFLRLVPFMQRLALGVDTLMARTETKIEANILFTDKATGEIHNLISSVECLVRDGRDLLLTGNAHIRREMKNEIEHMMKMAGDYAAEHQQRLITGLCLPRASYLYLDIVDSLKRIAGELTRLSEEL